MPCMCLFLTLWLQRNKRTAGKERRKEREWELHNCFCGIILLNVVRHILKINFEETSAKIIKKSQCTDYPHNALPLSYSSGRDQGRLSSCIQVSNSTLTVFDQGTNIENSILGRLSGSKLQNGLVSRGEKGQLGKQFGNY